MTIRPTSIDQMRLRFGNAARRRGTETAPVEMQCQYCQESVKLPKWYVRAEISLHFCSPECRTAWTQETPSFEVKLESRPEHRGGSWQLQAKKARDRDGFACQVCGATEEELGRQLDVHHKIPFHSFKSNVEANRLEHLISLCSACHAKLEARLQEELPLFCQP